MRLSDKALSDLKRTLDGVGIEKFSEKFTEDELHELGDLFLTILVEGLKHRVNEEKLKQQSKLDK